MNTYRDQYIQLNAPGQHGKRICVVSWRKITRQRLEWRYGPERAAVIMAKEDAEANADVAAWQSLGQPKGRAA